MYKKEDKTKTKGLGHYSRRISSTFVTGCSIFFFLSRSRLSHLLTLATVKEVLPAAWSRSTNCRFSCIFGLSFSLNAATRDVQQKKKCVWISWLHQ